MLGEHGDVAGGWMRVHAPPQKVRPLLCAPARLQRFFRTKLTSNNLPRRFCSHSLCSLETALSHCELLHREALAA